MFDKDRRYEHDYIETNPEVSRKRTSWRDVTPMWALPLLLIPLALFIWGGSLLLRNNQNDSAQPIVQDTKQQNNRTAERNNGLELGVGGAGDVSPTAVQSEPTPTPTMRPTNTPTPTGTNSAEAGVGGGPDEAVPSMPNTGHGW